jgi:hypothetical protein
METVNINGRTLWDRSFSFRKGMEKRKREKHNKLQKLERWTLICLSKLQILSWLFGSKRECYTGYAKLLKAGHDLFKM